MTAAGAPQALPGQAPFGLLGRRLGHSWSPQIHERLGSAPYALLELEPDQVEGFVREGDWRGLNVTIPYKRDAAAAADRRSPRVEALGVANTLVRMEDGSILAENTDVLGFSWMLGRFCRRRLGSSPAETLGGRKVLVLGSGGAAQAVRAAVEGLGVGADVRLVSRSGPEGYDTLEAGNADAALVINATPVGMYPNCPASPVPEDVLAGMAGLRGVLDVVYNPCRTGICLAAERLGLPCESGLAMLVAQALFSSELFQGRDLDDALVESVERELTAQTQNVVLVGMPGAGKTTTGRALARLLGRPFVDLDDAVEAEAGEAPQKIIRERGEEAFRRLETEACARYGMRSGIVIACGGGVVTRERNYPLLHQNGRIVLLDRPLDELEVAGRPLSEDRGVERLADERMPLYRAWADLVLGTTGSPQSDARAISDSLGTVPSA